MFCETHFSNRFQFDKLTSCQFFSFGLILTMISLAFWATLFDLYFLRTRVQVISSKLVRIFSANHNLFKFMSFNNANGNNSRIESVDDVRYVFSVVTTAIHSFSCAVEIRALVKIREYFRYLILMSLINHLNHSTSSIEI